MEESFKNKISVALIKTKIEILKGVRCGHGSLQKDKRTAKAGALVIKGSRIILNLQRFYT